MNNVQLVEGKDLLNAYNEGLTVKQVAERFGVSVGKAYYMLRDIGCHFKRPIDYPQSHVTPEQVAKSAASRRGKALNPETRRKISVARTIGYNGLNGYGHTKPHRSGYVLAYAPQHPHATKDGYVMLHTVIVERSIGRYLTDDEQVHHVNHIKDDNRLENLKIMNKKEHRMMHLRERWNGISTM